MVRAAKAIGRLLLILAVAQFFLSCGLASVLPLHTGIRLCRTLFVKSGRRKAGEKIPVIPQLIRKGKTNGEYSMLLLQLYNPEFYLLAYKNISANKGRMTPGVSGITIDGMSSDRIEKLIASLKDHSYHPKPARRT